MAEEAKEKINKRQVGRPKDETKSVTETDVYRLVRKHPEVARYDLTYEEVKAVFKAYGEILYRCMIDNVKIALPSIGYFKRKHKKGMTERTLAIPLQPFTQNADVKYVTYPKKPDYSLINFDVRKSLQKQFREETTEG